MQNALAPVGGFIRGVAILVVLFTITVVILAYTFGDVVRPGFMGVRQITVGLPFGPEQGYSEEGLPPGYHWSIPFYSKIHFVPQTVQLLHMHRNTRKHPQSKGAFVIQTTDGNSVEFDLTVATKFFTKKTEKHGGPADLINTYGLSDSSWRKNVRQIADDELKRELGKLETGEVYDPYKREEYVKRAINKMSERLAPVGIKVEAVLIRRYTYMAERIDNAIFAKNIQQQEERLNAMKSGLAEASANLEKVAAEWDAKIKTLKVEGANKATVIKSEGDLYQSEKEAEGDLMVAQAEAEVDRLKAAVLAKSIGAQRFVTRELAPLLGSLKGGVVSNIDPYDLKKWQEKLGSSSNKGGLN